MITTLTWSTLKELSRCPEVFVWGKEKYNEQESQNSLQVIQDLIEDQKLDWANCLISHLMTRPQYLAYAIFAAEEVLYLFEKRYPDDKRPRKAIEAAKEVLKNDNEENRKIADAAARAAKAVAYIVADMEDPDYATDNVASDAAHATAETAYAASAADGAVYAVANTIREAVNAVTSAAVYAGTEAGTEREKMQIQILNYGIELMKEEK